MDPIAGFVSFNVSIALEFYRQKQVFVCSFMNYLSAGRRLDFSSANMPAFRLKIAAQIIIGFID